jgi:beta-N-acetylhexosaminidase
MKLFHRFLQILTFSFILALLVFPSTFSSAKDFAQGTIPRLRAKLLLTTMTPEEKVGQLFLISFNGTDVGENSQIYDLIANHHIGGVILTRKNDNFVGPENTINEAHRLVSSLQLIEWQSSITDVVDTFGREIGSVQYIPLFVAMSQEGDHYPNDEIFNELTPLPNQLAIGSTWSKDLSRQVGEVMGKELSAIGINLYLGPTLDILDPMLPDSTYALGVSAFGENPYWVGELGRAYINGIHEGSDDRMAVIAKHFPGIGSSDRMIDEEVATVRKSFEQLKQTELYPFFTTTAYSATEGASADGLLVSHIRYEGLQGNIRVSTRPISFDTAALDQLMELSEFSEWRENGGLLVSDNLGSPAVRRFYDPVGQSFDARQVARNAVNAGNDLLIIDDFVATADADQYTTILRTLEFFTQKYREDAAFAQRVDQAVERSLTIKYRLYTDFDLEETLKREEDLTEIGNSQEIVFQIAQESATLLSPDEGDLGAALPNPPGISDRTVFITDIISEKQCSDCLEQIILTEDALRDAVVRLYGPQAGGQILQYRLSSFSFSDLNLMLDGSEEMQILQEELRAADWIVFVLLNLDQDRASSFALKRILSDRPDLLQDKYTVAFAFNAPYYLDATEISKLSAFYGIYSKLPSFVDIAARILFQEHVPTGALPVSLPNTGYDLTLATSPNAEQVIPLMLDIEAEEFITTETVSPESGFPDEPTLVPGFLIGDTLPLISGEIYDQNNHLVPDGTIVRFHFTYEGDTGASEQIESTTSKGVARTDFLIQNEGRLEIRATSGEAVNSDILVLNITEGEAAVITVILPTTTPTITVEPTATLQSPTPSPSPTTTPEPVEPLKTTGIDWIFSMIVIMIFAFGIFWIGQSFISTRWGIRWGLLSVIGGTIAYIYVSLNLPANEGFLERTGMGGLFSMIFLGIISGWLVGWLWQLNFERRARK